MKKKSITFWSKEFEMLNLLNSELAAILNEVAKDQGVPDKSVIKAEFCFGDMILTNGCLTLSDSAQQQDVSFGIVLDHSLEIFTTEKNGSSPVAILEAGQAFVLMDSPDLTLLPSCLLNISAGARSIFLLPRITEETSFWKLARNYNLQEKQPPKNLNEHWQIFSEIAKKSNSSWKATVLFFDKSWLDCTSIAGYRLYQYLRDTNLPNSHFFRKKLTFEMAFTETLSELCFRPDPFLIENIKQLFAISCHFMPGFVFAEDETLAPIQLLQEAFVQVYGLQYTPAILQPGYAKKGRRCYHSMQHPMLPQTTTRKHDTNLEQMREIYRVLYKTVEHIQNLDPITSELVEFISTELEFFHVNAQKQHREIEPSKNIEFFDPIIQRQISKFHFPFADTSAFLRRGCIAMSMPQITS